jgi:alpha-galactosidase
VHGDVTLLKQAMLHDPLVGAVCNPEEVWQMTDEMLVAQAEWLPQYEKKGEIKAAAHRLQKAVDSGTRVNAKITQGAARLHTATVDEMKTKADESRSIAQASDKGKMTKIGA